jgi:hypothetical protein
MLAELGKTYNPPSVNEKEIITAQNLLASLWFNKLS